MRAELIQIRAPHSGFCYVPAHDGLNVIDRSARGAFCLDCSNFKKTCRRRGAICDESGQANRCDHADPQSEWDISQKRLQTRADRLGRSTFRRALHSSGAALANSASITNFLSDDWISQESLPSSDPSTGSADGLARHKFHLIFQLNSLLAS